MPSIPQRASAGFTLIELMIVVAIVAILAAIAVPQYTTYVIRAQASEGMVAATSAKIAVGEFAQNNGRFPGSNLSAGLPSATSLAGKYVSSVELQNTGAILISYSKSDANLLLRTQTLTLSPVDKGGSVSWACKSTLSNEYMPSSCRQS